MLNFSRSKNTVNILIKNWLDMCICAVVFWACGFGLIYGPDKGHFIGSSYFFFSGIEGNRYNFTTELQSRPKGLVYSLFFIQNANFPKGVAQGKSTATL